VTGTNGTGGGTASISIPPVNAPDSSTALVDLRGTTNFSFGTGPGGLAGGAISNMWFAQSDLQVLAGTLGAGGVLSNFTLTVWLRQPSAPVNNYRLCLISTGAPPTTARGDGGGNGNNFFLGENSGGGLMFIVNGLTTDSISPNVAPSTSWNNDGVLGPLQLGKWYFVAITYHIDANPANSSCVLYSGSQSNTCIPAYTYTAVNLGGSPLDLSAATSICLMNRFSGGRAFPGELDYFNIYTNVLTPDQITAVQDSQLGFSPPPPPPPPTFPTPGQPAVSPTNTFYALSPSGVTLTESSGGATPLHYQWRTDGGGNGGALTNIPDATNTNFYFYTTNAGTYSFACLVTNSYGPALSPTAQVYVLPATPSPPVINFTDGACVLTWTGGSGLLEATNVSGPWTTNAHMSPFTFSPTGAAKFYRTYYP
jgi:hypothetical protein